MILEDRMAQHKASREIKKYLAEVVRNDWDWPPDLEPAADGTRPNITAHAFVTYEAVEYRERYHGTTDDGSSDEDDDMSSSGTEDLEAAYKFDSPDAVGGMLEAQMRRRKKRRKMRLEQELRYNTGLRCFVERRNAWTAAKSRTAEAHSDGDGSDNDDGGVNVETNGVQAVDHVDDPDDANATPIEKTPTLTTTKSSSSTHADSAADIPDVDPLIPVPPPLISPTNPVRASIAPKAYADIYTKIVLSARTPTTPINLSDMTRALVQGWKDSGEWPAQTAPANSAAAAMQSRTAALEVTAAGRRGRAVPARQKKVAPAAAAETNGAAAGGIGTGAGGGVNGGARAEQSIGLGEGILAHHPHVKRGVEGMKRVFRLSGGGGADGSAKQPAAMNGL